MREYLKIINISDWKDGKINGKGVRYHSNGVRYIVHILIILEIEMNIIFFLMVMLIKEIGIMGKQMVKGNLLIIVATFF